MASGEPSTTGVKRTFSCPVCAHAFDAAVEGDGNIRCKHCNAHLKLVVSVANQKPREIIPAHLVLQFQCASGSCNQNFGMRFDDFRKSTVPQKRQCPKCKTWLWLPRLVNERKQREVDFQATIKTSLSEPAAESSGSEPAPNSPPDAKGAPRPLEANGQGASQGTTPRKTRAAPAETPETPPAAQLIAETAAAFGLVVEQKLAEPSVHLSKVIEAFKNLQPPAEEGTDGNGAVPSLDTLDALPSQIVQAIARAVKQELFAPASIAGAYPAIRDLLEQSYAQRPSVIKLLENLPLIFDHVDEWLNYWRAQSEDAALRAEMVRILEDMQSCYHTWQKYYQVERIPSSASGEPFDSRLHSISGSRPAEAPEQEGRIASVKKYGYRFGDLPLRKAQVTVYGPVAGDSLPPPSPETPAELQEPPA